MVFKSLINKSDNVKLYFGLPEAEAESNENSRVYLPDVYEEQEHLYEDLSHEKFILVGRKGSGKSAFARKTYLLSKEYANMFCSFIRQDVISLEQMVQIESQDKAVNKESLFKWIVYTHLLKLIFSNEAIDADGNYKLLMEFIKKNSGFIDINKLEILELVRKNNYEVNIVAFKRYMKSKFGSEVQIKESKASFYKLIPHLEQVIIAISKKERATDKKNEYIIFFDDLDIGFNSEDPKSIESLISLIRATKYINNDIFSENGIDAKIIILIRDDMERTLSLKATDIGKTFSSYSCEITWVDNHSDDHGKLKSLIEKRAKAAFKNANVSYSTNTAWEHLVSDSFAPKTSFKYILDYTFHRPRDLILFFMPLQKYNYNIPLSKKDVNALLKMYASELTTELKNELSSFYNEETIWNMFKSLKDINSKRNCSYNDALFFIKEHCNGVDPELLIKDLFDRSVIGNLDPENNWVNFKYRASGDIKSDNEVDKEKYIILHSGVRASLHSV